MARSRYAPRPRPTPIPSQPWNTEPTYCLRVNAQWVGHILGVMEALDQWDTWIGTEEEIQAARDQVNEIMAAFDVCEEVDPMIVGQINFFGLDEPPEKWLACDWSYYPKADYPLLYAAIGDKYGVPPDSSMFYVPDLRYRSPMGEGALNGYFGGAEIANGQKYGEAAHLMTEAELVPHNHTVANSWLFGVNGGRNSTTGTAANHNSTLTSSNKGGGQPFNVVHPVIGLLACIYAGE